MSQVSLKRIIKLLQEFTKKNREPLKIILTGALALDYYGLKERSTKDFDAEVKGNVESLFNFLKSKKIPSDIGENIASWSIINMPPFYRRRAITIHRDNLLVVKVLHPLDFIIAKLRRFTNQDLEDAIFVANKFNIKEKVLRKVVKKVIDSSPKDTALFIFKRNVDFFLKKIKKNVKDL